MSYQDHDAFADASQATMADVLAWAEEAGEDYHAIREIEKIPARLGMIDEDIGLIPADLGHFERQVAPSSYGPVARRAKDLETSRGRGNSRDLLLSGEVSMLVGPSNTGKTAVAIQLAHHVATGTPLLGRDVRQGMVLYIAAEGARSVLTRAHAAFRDEEGREHFVALEMLPDLRERLAGRLTEVSALEAEKAAWLAEREALLAERRDLEKELYALRAQLELMERLGMRIGEDAA